MNKGENTMTVQTLSDGGVPEDVVRELWVHVQKTETCWIWTGPLFGKYGCLKIGKNSVGVHRLAWRIANNADIPSGRLVRHKCDVPLCVRPDHLELGTYAQNNRDTVHRNRRDWKNMPFGDRHTHAVLTVAVVNEMRVAARGGTTITAIAKAFGVSYNTAHSAIRGHSWGSATEPPVAPTRRKRRTHRPRLHEQHPELYREAQRLCDEGLSVRQIANQLGISKAAAYRWCRSRRQGGDS